MALSLADPDDVLAFIPALGTPTQAQQTQMTSLLSLASAVIRSYTRRTFTLEQTTERLRPIGYKILLPKRPVVSVDAVSLLVWNMLMPLPGWVWDGADELWLSADDSLINVSETILEWTRYHTAVAQVTYTHGYDVVPDDVKFVACSMAARGMTAPNFGAIDRENVGDYGYSMAPTQVYGPLALNDAERAILSPYRRPVATVELR